MKSLFLIICISVALATIPSQRGTVSVSSTDRSGYLRGMLHMQALKAGDVNSTFATALVSSIAGGMGMSKTDGINVSLVSTTSSLVSGGAWVNVYFTEPKIGSSYIKTSNIESLMNSIIATNEWLAEYGATQWRSTAHSSSLSNGLTYRCNGCTRLDTATRNTMAEECKPFVNGLAPNVPLFASPAPRAAFISSLLSATAGFDVPQSCKNLLSRIACDEYCHDGKRLLPCKSQCEAIEDLCGKGVIASALQAAGDLRSVLEPYVTCTSSKFAQSPNKAATPCLDVYDSEWLRVVTPSQQCPLRAAPTAPPTTPIAAPANPPPPPPRYSATSVFDLNVSKYSDCFPLFEFENGVIRVSAACQAAANSAASSSRVREGAAEQTRKRVYTFSPGATSGLTGVTVVRVDTKETYTMTYGGPTQGVADDGARTASSAAVSAINGNVTMRNTVQAAIGWVPQASVQRGPTSGGFSAELWVTLLVVLMLVPCFLFLLGGLIYCICLRDATLDKTVKVVPELVPDAPTTEQIPTVFQQGVAV